MVPEKYFDPDQFAAVLDAAAAIEEADASQVDGVPDAALGRKIERLRRLATEAGADPLIAIDGGITEATIGIAAGFRPDIIVSGSAVFKSGASIAANLEGLRRAAGL